MEPQHEHEPPMELPQPQETGRLLPEVEPVAPETRGNQTPSGTPAAPQPTGQDTNQPTQTAVPAPQPSQQPLRDDLIADDADLIEKEWVVKAKAIVMQTKDDPYAQNKEMTKVKADYMKKRYNKDLKMTEA